MTKAAIWARVSTSLQETENQIIQLQAWADRHDVEIVAVYRVEESAWKGAHTKALTQVLQDARRGRFNVLLTWALDRLSRQGIGPMLEILQQFEARRVAVWSFQEPWTQTSGPTRDLLVAIIGWVAEMESKRRSERTRAGLERAKAQGKRLGRPPGSKDGRQRKKSGYFRRWTIERENPTAGEGE